MARYIEKEPLCAWLENMGVSDFIIRKIESEANFPAADVVPKSEYDDLMEQFLIVDAECDRMEKAESKQYDVLIKAKAEVAREIFEEIDKLAKEGGVIWTHYAAAVLAELKKKYTEGE